ncbi:thioesterase II family protein [Acinetobacter pollinis]|uniref:Thioesterase n=1 Tax=Acinetobacter pollinis TaxID=2605270 RepID=A0ABU6DXD6_9GAMM|nr:thioesterase domain-containing protein [Acinetobacter pollinis]MEB5477844.1 thioesterase [Acinetobacter pollinis]
MTNTKSYFIPISKPKAKRRLFCFPFAGGLASYYLKFTKFIPEEVELVSIQYPRHLNLKNIQELVDFIYNEIKHLTSEIPFAFFGHSMGAIVAYELSKKMILQKDKLPLYLFISGRSAPTESKSSSNIHTLSEEDFIKKLMILNGLPPVFMKDRKKLQEFLPFIRNDIKLIETWHFSNHFPLDISFVLFNGNSDPEVNLNEINSWQLHTTRKIHSYIFKGDHFYLNNYIPEIIEIIFKIWK